MSAFNSKAISGEKSTSYFVCELVDAHLATGADTHSVYFELLWGSLSARSSVKKAVGGIVTMTERMRLAVPSLGQRRLPMLLHMLRRDELVPGAVHHMGWMQVPSHEVLAGKKIRCTFPLYAPDTEFGPTVFELNAAFFIEDTLMSLSTPSDIPYSDVEYYQARPRAAPQPVVASSSGSSGSSPYRDSSTAARELHQQVATALVNNMSLASLTSEQAAILVAQFANAGGDLSDVASTASFQLKRRMSNAPGRDEQQQQPHRRVHVESISTQTDLSGPVVPASMLSAGAKVPQVPKIMGDAEEASKIRRSFDFPTWTAENTKPDRSSDSRTTVAGGVDLRKPVDLLAMKQSVAAWPRDEVEGLIAYGEQMKRYSSQLEEQNARLVVGIMRNATAEIVDMPRSVDRALSMSAGRMLSRSPSHARSVSNILGLQNRYHQSGSRSGSALLQPQQDQKSMGRRTASPPLLFSGGAPPLDAADSHAYLSPGLSRVLRSASEADVPFNVHTFEEMQGKPQFVTKLEMSRGEPLNEADKSHVMRHFDDL